MSADVQVPTLSRLEHGFEPRWGRQENQALRAASAFRPKFDPKFGHALLLKCGSVPRQPPNMHRIPAAVPAPATPGDPKDALLWPQLLADRVQDDRAIVTAPGTPGA